MIIFYFISNLFKSGSKPNANNGTTSPATTNYKPSTNLFPHGQLLSLYVYLSEKENFTEFDNSSYLVWKYNKLRYGSWEDGPNADGTRSKSHSFNISENVQNNGSLYLHVYICKHGISPDPNSRHYQSLGVIHQMKSIYRKKRLHKASNLITGKTEVHADLLPKTENEKPEIISYWHPNLTINLLDDHTSWVEGSVPAPLNQFVKFDGQGHYFPVIFLNDYWNLNSDYMPVNSSVETLHLNLIYGPLSLIKWQFFASQTTQNPWTALMGGDQQTDDEKDSMKQMLLETNPYLIGLTICVSLLHSVFEFLAFKNDIQFWNSRKSLEGLSVRSVFFGVVQSVIVLLYVLDNDTNTMIIISCLVGLGIDAWKITKVMKVELRSIPRISIQDRATYEESPTKEYDRMAFKYLSWALFPMFACYTVYSLLYHEHKGWYSFCLGICYGFLLMFGFIMMTPQLFINYKMKSIAHLPWRMLTYKALNTFIDDIFAFIIKMPTLYRIGCLRDDLARQSGQNDEESSSPTAIENKKDK
ncbi:uncharacterized protein TRIADDRAFT_49806 [Trichoplax adhaerens]|uniref:Cleft lip and palate transmembrane protein 1 n=1 Tax=Trichoplax adhaerens TaxID=10228 RepID=B3RJJ1_TRIAD|nr:hypothetical protein TRIADDRAFT_49806 [Trichoplax adhaerens]EDV29106.1 hypothetical protein TRIADDRAFT_49806 [Trichoplax adhaerens]|eukprot:XP_002108308.1 hypothetical protein TRIADDRAFT_49806 [Trichoplax adhaerens]